ncbi:hypothetical protein E4U19_006938 [Claviceps sp. Clav32 group G5]|nr:hypothetical protein E4U19_006938 [Claviceps sp. Clav32 group G5]
MGKGAMENDGVVVGAAESAGSAQCSSVVQRVVQTPAGPRRSRRLTGELQRGSCNARSASGSSAPETGSGNGRRSRRGNKGNEKSKPARDADGETGARRTGNKTQSQRRRPAAVYL